MRTSAHHLNKVRVALRHRSAILERSDLAENRPIRENLYGEDVKIVSELKLNPRWLTSAEKDEAVAKYAQGMTMTAIAADYGCHYTTVGVALRQRGVEIRPRGKS